MTKTVRRTPTVRGTLKGFHTSRDGAPAGDPPAPHALPRLLLLPLLVLLVPVLVACGKKIGDECQTQFDCNDEDDSRSCDISQPGGYCTVEGCDEKSCPEDSVCIRFFPRAELLPNRCSPVAGDRGASDCTHDELCLDAGRCAPRATEFRRCVKTCGNDGDCRDEYQCRLVGGQPAIPPDDPGTIPHENMQPITAMPLTGPRFGAARYCAPRVR